MTYSKDSYRGKFTPKRPEKYVGDVNSITYRSSYELRFMKWCDQNDSILKWNSEEVVVPYFSPVDKQMHRYFVDFVVELKNVRGEVKVYLVEVKPFKYTQEPVPPKRKSRQFIEEVIQWEVNKAKWASAKHFADSKGWQFMLVTERDLGIVR
jgi:TnsA endonuclease N terminal